MTNMSAQGEHESGQAAQPPRQAPARAIAFTHSVEALADRLSAVAVSWSGWAMRPRVRLTLVGLLLLCLGALLMVDSVWTLPLVIIGGLMVVVAWIGHRLEGRLTLDWGPGGTELALRATIKPAQPQLPRADGRPVDAPASAAPLRVPNLDSPAGEVIEGEAHTVEIPVAELKALIAAAEATEIRIRRGGHAAESPDAERTHEPAAKPPPRPADDPAMWPPRTPRGGA